MTIHSQTIVYGTCVKLEDLMEAVEGMTLAEYEKEFKAENEDLQMALWNWWHSNETTEILTEDHGLFAIKVPHDQASEHGFDDETTMIAIGIKLMESKQIFPLFIGNFFQTKPIEEEKFQHLLDQNQDYPKIVQLLANPQMLMVLDDCGCCS